MSLDNVLCVIWTSRRWKPDTAFRTVFNSVALDLPVSNFPALNLLSINYNDKRNLKIIPNECENWMFTQQALFLISIFGRYYDNILQNFG